MFEESFLLLEKRKGKTVIKECSIHSHSVWDWRYCMV